MRMSVHKNDPGYHPRAHFYSVLLDGKDLPMCITADEDRGYAVVHKIDSEGNAFLNETKDATVKEKVFGKIEIVLVVAVPAGQGVIGAEPRPLAHCHGQEQHYSDRSQVAAPSWVACRLVSCRFHLSASPSNCGPYRKNNVKSGA